MLEIVALFFLCSKMGKMLRAKGWKPLFMQIMVVLAWFGSMFFAAVAYGVYLGLTRGPEAVEDVGLAIYPWMLLAAAMSQVVIFGIAALLTDRTKAPAPGFHAQEEQGFR